VKGNVKWYYDSLTPRMLALPLVVDAAVEELLEELAEEVQEYARTHASWDDRSGEAREGLTAEVVDEGLFHNSIVLYHTVDYGIWLEIRWNGKYAIILPTIEHYGPIVMGRLGGAFGGME
jgi:hypothetical protein